MLARPLQSLETVTRWSHRPAPRHVTFTLREMPMTTCPSHPQNMTAQRPKTRWGTWLLCLLLPSLLLGCQKSETPRAEEAPAPQSRTLTLAAYTTPREVYRDALIPAFQKHWKEKTGEDVKFEDTYQGSGAAARAIISGLEADVAALALEGDLEQLVKANLVKSTWKDNPAQGMVSRSVVVLAVREGNPKGIKGWEDLRQPGLSVLTPNVRTSGGAMWNVAAIYGAALRGKTPVPANDAAAAEGLLADVLKNVSIMDKGARESIVTFERGVGDVAITYENEVFTGRAAGRTYEAIIPASTILIENPIAVVDTVVDKKGTRELAEAFVAFVRSPEGQRLYASKGFRPVDETVAQEVGQKFPAPQDLFTIRELGGWPQVLEQLFGKGAIYERALAKKEAK